MYKVYDHDFNSLFCWSIKKCEHILFCLYRMPILQGSQALPACLSDKNVLKDQFRAQVEWYWQGQMEIIVKKKKKAPVPLCPLQISPGQGSSHWLATRATAQPLKYKFHVTNIKFPKHSKHTEPLQRPTGYQGRGNNHCLVWESYKTNNMFCTQNVVPCDAISSGT